MTSVRCINGLNLGAATVVLALASVLGAACSNREQEARVVPGDVFSVLLSEDNSVPCDSVPADLCGVVQTVVTGLELTVPVCSTVASHCPNSDTLYDHIRFKLLQDEIFVRSYGKWDADDLQHSLRAYDSAYGISPDSGTVFTDSAFIRDYSDVRDAIARFASVFEPILAEHEAVKRIHIVGTGFTLWSLYPKGTPRSETTLANFHENFLMHAANPTLVHTCLAGIERRPVVCIRFFGNKLMQVFYPIYVEGRLRGQVEVFFDMRRQAVER